MRLTVRVPQPPEAPDAPAELDVRDVPRERFELLLGGGLAGYVPVATAALLTACADHGASARVLEVRRGFGLHALLCAGILRPQSVDLLTDEASVAVVERVATRNRLEIGVHTAQSPSGPRRARVRIDDLTRVAEVEPNVLLIGGDASPLWAMRSARRTIERLRPTILVELPPAARRINAAPPFVTDLGYVGYRLTARPSWRPRARIRIGAGAEHRYVLWSPTALDEEFPVRFDCWREEVAVCDGDRNRRPPTVRSSIEWLGDTELGAIASKMLGRVRPTVRAAWNRAPRQVSRTSSSSSA